VKELCEGDGLNNETEDPLDKIPASALKMAKVAQTVSTISAQDLARALTLQEGDANIARARLHALQKLLTEAERYLSGD